MLHERGLFMASLEQRLQAIPLSLLGALLDVPDTSSVSFAAIVEVSAALLKRPESASIDQILESLHTRDGFRSHTSLLEQQTQRQLLFTILGWVSCLYQPQPLDATAAAPDNGDQQAPSGTLRSNHGSQDAYRATRPMVELLCGYEDYLPLPSARRDEHRSIHVAKVNASSLAKIGKISIVWTTSIAAHLQFVPIHRTLHMFALPTAFKLWKCKDDSITSLLIRDFYQIREQQTVPDRLYEEVELSYELIFGQDTKAREYYRKEERQRASRAGYPQSSSSLVDSHLDQLCGLDAPSSERLLRLQEYMESIEINDISALWRDRRDLLRWYTFWAVVIVGAVGLFLSLLQAVLSAGQLAYSISSYKAQVASG